MRSSYEASSLWPPKVWIERPDSTQPKLERRLAVDCGGTFDAPEADDVAIHLGDCVYVDFRSTDVALAEPTTIELD